MSSKEEEGLSSVEMELLLLRRKLDVRSALLRFSLGFNATLIGVVITLIVEVLKK